MVHGRSLVSRFVPFALAALCVSLPAQKIEWWAEDFESAVDACEFEDAGMLLLYFWVKENPDCSAMFGGTMSEEKVQAALSPFVCMGAERATDAGDELFDRFRIERSPTILFLTPDGTVVDAIVGYLPVDGFLAEIERIRKGEGTVLALREAVSKAPDDLSLQLALMRKLRETGDKKGSQEVIDAIVAKDPKCKREPAAEAMLVRLTDEVFPPDSSPQSWDLEPLHAFLRKQKNKRILFLGYTRLGDGAYQQEDLKAWAKFAERAWKSIPKDKVQTWGQDHATVVCKHGKELEKVNKKILKLAIKISKASLAITEKANKDDKPYLAWAMYLHAGVLKEGGKRKDAFKLLDKAIELAPDNETYTKAKKWWQSGG